MKNMHLIVGIDAATTEFTLDASGTEVGRFPGTVLGAVACANVCADAERVSLTPDLFHPDEFPKFAPYAIAIASGEFDEAIAAGVIAKDTGEDDNVEEGPDV